MKQLHHFHAQSSHRQRCQRLEQTLIALYLLRKWMMVILHNWHCQGPHDRSNRATSTLDFHWGRAARVPAIQAAMPHPHLILTRVLFYYFFLLFCFSPCLLVLSCLLYFPVGTLLSLCFLVYAFVTFVLNWWISSLVSFTHCITHLVFSFSGLLLFCLCVYMCVFH